MYKINTINFDLFDELFDVTIYDEDSELWYINDFNTPQLQNHDKHFIWTVVDDGETVCVVPGIHKVNRLAYTITHHPWTDIMEESGLQVLVHDYRWDI
jgi:hypothetical protein